MYSVKLTSARQIEMLLAGAEMAREMSFDDLQGYAQKLPTDRTVLTEIRKITDYLSEIERLSNRLLALAELYPTSSHGIPLASHSHPTLSWAKPILFEVSSLEKPAFEYMVEMMSDYTKDVSQDGLYENEDIAYTIRNTCDLRERVTEDYERAIGMAQLYGQVQAYQTMGAK